MSEQIKYEFVLITLSDRYDHFHRCIESFKRNELAKYKKLFGAVDYPLSEKYEDGYIYILYRENGFVPRLISKKNYILKRQLMWHTSERRKENYTYFYSFLRNLVFSNIPHLVYENGKFHLIDQPHDWYMLFFDKQVLHRKNFGAGNLWDKFKYKHKFGEKI